MYMYLAVKILYIGLQSIVCAVWLAVHCDNQIAYQHARRKQFCSGGATCKTTLPIIEGLYCLLLP